MWKPRWLLAIPLALAATVSAGPARASSIRDAAGMFSADAVRRAEAELNRIERAHRITTTIETVDSLEGRDIAEVTLERAERSGAHGLFLLMSKKEHKIYDEVSAAYSRALNQERQRTIRDAFTAGFRKGDFDAGLLQGVRAINSQVSAAVAENPGRARPGGAVPIRRRGGNPQGGFGLGSLLGIGLLIIGVLFFVRLLGSLFGGGARAGYPGPGGRMGGPGYGPGYGGGGGGFMSSLFGGLGGALAGNWLYDQFSGGRHHGGYTENTSYGDAGAPDATPDTWAGGSGGGSDWGGGDAGGGGGDWGGGGGGDWGGGGGGGDW